MASILESSTAISSQVARDRPGQVLAATAYHVLNGGCFYALPPEHYFLEYVFQRYGNDTHNLTLAGAFIAVPHHWKVVPSGKGDGQDFVGLHKRLLQGFHSSVFSDHMNVLSS